jgi:hypothetical protein
MAPYLKRWAQHRVKAGDLMVERESEEDILMDDEEE